jgi:hypothetical protein
MAASIVDLFIHHHGSFSEPDLEYVGGDVMHLEGLDANSLSFWDITNILEDYLEYNYKDIPRLMLYYSITMKLMTTYVDLLTTKTS